VIYIECKACTKCGENKPLSEYYSSKKNSKTKGDYVYYHPTCKECDIKKSSKWLKDNNERHNELCKKYYKENAHNRRQNIKNSERKRRANGKYVDWQRNNKDKIKKYREDRREKKHTFTINKWKECLEFFGNSCAYCGMSEEEHKDKYNQVLHKEHVDHNGSNGIDNCVPSCKICNSSKHTSEMEEWYSSKSFFSKRRLNKIHKWININTK